MGEIDYGQIIAHSDVAEDIGAVVTFTDLLTGANRTGTIDNDGYCIKKLPAFKRYRVTLGSYSSAPIDLGCGESHYEYVGLDPSNWAGIKRIVNAGKAADYISNGDRFEVELTNGETLIYLANVNTYGLGEVDFIPTYCMNTTRQHHTGNTNAGGWNQSDLRTYLNQTFILTLPQDLQEVISEKPVKATIGSQQNQIQTAEDKIWIPTEKEVFGQITYSGSTESTVNNMYPIFVDSASRVRTQGAAGAAVGWWLCSPAISTSFFCNVNTSGTPYNANASLSNGVLPCFRISPDA